MIQHSGQNPLRMLGVLFLVITGVSLSGCETSAPTATAAPGSHPSKYGSYLAGRYATKQRDSAAAAQYFDQALGFDPKNTQLLERLLISNMSKGDLDAAADAAVELARATPDNRIANLIIGIKLFKENKFVDARATFDKLDGKALSELGNKFGTAWAFIGENKPDDAIQIAKRLLGAQGLEAFATYHKALLEDVGGRPTEALQSMALAYKVSKGESLRVVQHYGAMLERAGDISKAKAVYDAYLEKSPEHPVITLAVANALKGVPAGRPVATPAQGLGEIYYSVANSLNQDTAVDLSIFYTQIALALNPKDELAITMLGERFQTAERFDESNEAFRRIPKSSPVYQNAQLQIGSNSARQGNTNEAIATLTNALTQSPRDVELYATMGDTFREKERYAEAEQAYSKAISLITKPLERHWVLYYTRGVSRERLRRWTEAEADLELALRLKPEQPLVMNYLAYTWIEHGVNPAKALAMLHRAVELREDDGFIVDSLGWAYYRRGEYAKAVKYLERAVLLEPGEATINDHLGDAFWRVGRQLEARFQWKHALGLKPDTDDIPRIQSKLDSGLDVVEASDRAKRAGATATQ